MTLDQTVDAIIKWVVPAIPYLVSGIKTGGKKAAETLGELMASRSFDTAQAIWKKLTKGKENKKSMTFVAEKILKNPKNKMWHSILKEEIKSLLSENPVLLKDLVEMIGTEHTEQFINAKQNKKAKIIQSTSGKSKQKVIAENNENLVIRQNVKK